jgi:hypothetical protein
MNTRIKKLLPVAIGLVLLLLLIYVVTLLMPHKVMYYPFQSSANGGWGLISSTGRVLVNDFWPVPPSIPSEGIVRVGPDKDGLYSYYTVSRKPKKIGDSYANAHYFSEGLAATAKPDGPLTFINKNGKPVLTLKADPSGKLITRAGAFYNGLALVMNEDGKWGVIDRKGNFVVPPKYNLMRDYRNGYAWARTRVLGDSNQVTNTDEYLDLKGKSMLPVSVDVEYGPASDGILPFSRDHRQSWGLMTIKGKQIMAPQADIVNVGLFNKGYATFFSRDRKCGIIDRKGKIVVPAKYDYVVVGEKSFSAATQGRWAFHDMKDKALGEASFDKAYPFMAAGTLVRDQDKWQVINRKGKVLNKVTIAAVNTQAVDEYVSRILGTMTSTTGSDFYSPEMIVGKVAEEVSATQFNGISQTTSPADLLKLMEAEKPNFYCGTNSVTIHNRRIGNLASYTIEVVYDQNLQPDASGNPVVATPDPNEPPKIVKVTYSLTMMGKKAEKAPEIAAALRDKVKQCGFVPSQDPTSAGHWTVSPNPLEQWFSSPDGAAHISVYQSSGFITVTYRFWDKA